MVAEISGATLWRWLSSDALRPWQHRSWIFPRDPNFADKAGPILDLYERVWEGAPLGADDYVISADEKTSIQARRRKQPTLPPAPNRPTRVEHEYFREGAWTYLAAWDVHGAKVFGRCEVKSGIAPVDRLVGEVMSQEPSKSARRVFWIMGIALRMLLATLAHLAFCFSVKRCDSEVLRPKGEGSCADRTAARSTMGHPARENRSWMPSRGRE